MAFVDKIIDTIVLTLILRLEHSTHLFRTVRWSNGPRVAISQYVIVQLLLI